MGGIDNKDISPEGCVFVHRTFIKAHRVIEGPVMVTKHPASHLGDVRMLKAVNIACLRDHRDVILFSRHGARPEPDKMSGSNFDGDEYAVTGNPYLSYGILMVLTKTS